MNKNSKGSMRHIQLSPLLKNNCKTIHAITACPIENWSQFARMGSVKICAACNFKYDFENYFSRKGSIHYRVFLIPFDLSFHELLSHMAVNFDLFHTEHYRTV